MTPERASRPLVRPYVETGGRARADRCALERITLLHRVGGDVPRGLSDKQREAMELLRAGALSLVETASYLRLPVSLSKVVLADLIAAGCLKARPPAPLAAQHDPEMLRKVLDGLRRAKSSS
ncbi:DUF742 domain-containing protein [Streptomyces liangshanensis]|uniref:DUF742 domain-containing protein n=1 Tax=Streptomyces liangshanensis TaxID=2717324 RepID=A0A6G9H533_9ACTN|nr:DUF742 domain-containing protein [Streptomyces liangshanensis]QIQ05416.1 DUF742 domain-containing protein [Streptomyces liangshanensis]